MEITLYRYTCKANKINKSNGLTLVGTVQGVLRDATSITNPSILFNDSASPVPLLSNCNYCYISQFNRYYFVNDIIKVRQGLFQLECKCDVLYSFKDIIYTQTGYVTRCSNSTYYNRLLEDNRVSFETKDTSEDYKIINVTSSFINKTFDETPSGWNIAITMINDYGYVPATLYPPDSGTTNLLLKAVGESYFYAQFSTTTYCADYSSLSNLSKKCLDDESGEVYNFIKSVVAFPFSLSYQGTYPNNLIPFYYNKYDDLDNRIKDDEGNYVELPVTAGITTGYMVIADFVLNKQQLRLTTIPDTLGDDFFDYEPYFNVELYLPFYGWITLDLSKLYGHRILVYYNVSYEDGTGTVYVYSHTYNELVFSAPCQLGVKIGLSSNNSLELKKSLENAKIGLATGLIASGLNIGVGLTGNPYAMVRGVSYGADSVAQYATAKNSRIQKGYSTSNEGLNSLYNTPYVLIRYHYNNISDTNTRRRTTNFINNLGIPTNKYITLSSFSDGDYVEVKQVHLSNFSTATKPEVDEIEKLLADGVYI